METALVVALILAGLVVAREWGKCPACGGDGTARVRVREGGKDVVEVRYGQTCGRCAGKGRV